MAKQIRYGMVGGHMQAFIGDVHRKALQFDPRVKLAAGCFSTREELNRETAELYELDPDRVYADYRQMAAAEAAREDKIDFVSIVTPNCTHFEIAMAFLEAGIHVMCEKPLCMNTQEALALREKAREKGLIFGVTHTYTGYTMSKVMREMIAGGMIGEIMAVNAEYAQDWLINQLDPENSNNSNIAIWRMDPKFSGAVNCVGDIGTHVMNYVSYVTGLKIRRLLATTNKYGKPLDMNANIIVEYDNGANGAYWCSQIACGHCNGLLVRVFGDKGSLEWHQENPEVIRYAPKNESPRIINRHTAAVTQSADAFSRIPNGHPEGLYIAFANLYKEFVSAVEAKKAGRDADGFDFPTVDAGVEGMRFIEAVVRSAENNNAWVDF